MFKESTHISDIRSNSSCALKKTGIPVARQNMRCLWSLFKWPKRQRRAEEERQLSLDTLDRVTLLQQWDRSRNGEAYNGTSSSSLQGRYVRFGIGGAGNFRKSEFLFLNTDHTISLPVVLT
jgi:hypothetical protein